MLPASVRDGFIDRLAETGNVSAAARALGINRMTAYGWREDPDFASRWDLALAVARQGLRERVVETACAMGLGRWVPVLDPISGEPVLDDDFEPEMRLDTGGVDARVLMKMMDKVIRSEDGGGPSVEIHNSVSVRVPSRPRLVGPEADEIPDADFEEVDDGC